MTASVARELLPASVVSIGLEADSWLQDLTGVSPDRPIMWSSRGYRRGGVAGRNLEHPLDFEIWQPYAAADLMWSWLHGSLPEGCSRTMRHTLSRVFDHGLG